MDTENKESIFINLEGVKLYRKIYKPIESPTRAFVYLCHGLFEHSQSWYYDSIINPLNAIGCLILTHDHYGHGRSDGDRGIISSVDILIRDTLMDIEQTVEELKISETVPLFIYGHSLGGLIAVHSAIKKKDYFKGVILEAPALELNVHKLTILLIRFLNRIKPRAKLRKTDYSHICRNVQHVEEIKNDKMQINSTLSVKTALSIVDSIILVQSLFNKFNTPVFIGHGDSDKMCVLRGSERFMKDIASADKTLVVYPKARHRLRMEIDNVDIEFREKVVAWINERIS